MAVFNFDQVDSYVEANSGNVSFLKLVDDGWYAKIRFMYGPGETFQGHSVHNVSMDPKRPKFIPCLREPGQPLDVCPLCQSGNATCAQYYLPVFVISLTKVINGIPQPEEMINQPMVFQRGKTFQGAMASAIRQSNGKPLCSVVFNIVRSGKANDQKTTYILEKVAEDNTTLDQLPPRVEVVGTPLLPKVSAADMTQYISAPAATITPRTVSASTFGTNTVMTNQVPGQAPAQAPRIPF